MQTKQKLTKMQSPPPLRLWVEQMADVLRDESSGIRFCNRYGFCSTGSQISWLPLIANQMIDVEGSQRPTFSRGHPIRCAGHTLQIVQVLRSPF